MKRVMLLTALAAGTVLLLGACGSDDDGTDTQEIDSTEEAPADNGEGDSSDAAPCLEGGDLTVDGEGVEVDPEGEGETRVEVGDNSVVVGKDGSVEINGEQYAPGDIEDCADPEGSENPDDPADSDDDSGSENPDDSGSENPDDPNTDSENPDTGSNED